jgi:hypothetical protein
LADDVNGGRRLKSLVKGQVCGGLQTRVGLRIRDGIKRLGVLQRVFPTIGQLQRPVQRCLGFLAMRGTRLRCPHFAFHRNAREQSI